MDDPRNTDDAWVVSRAFHIHDEENFLAAYPLMDMVTHPTVCEVTWAVAHRNLDLYVNHLDIVKAVVRLLPSRSGKASRGIFF